MRSSATASLCRDEKPIGSLFWHPVGGRNHHRRPSSSSRRSPWRGGSSSPSGLRVCTSSYVFDLSLSCSWFGTILMYRELCYYSWIIWCFSPSTFLWWIESCCLSFCSIGFSIRFENTWCMSCDGISVVTMGCSIDSLDVCFGTQLADSRGDIGVIYA